MPPGKEKKKYPPQLKQAAYGRNASRLGISPNRIATVSFFPILLVPCFPLLVLVLLRLDREGNPAEAKHKKPKRFDAEGRRGKKKRCNQSCTVNVKRANEDKIPHKSILSCSVQAAAVSISLDRCGFIQTAQIPHPLEQIGTRGIEKPVFVGIFFFFRSPALGFALGGN